MAQKKQKLGKRNSTNTKIFSSILTKRSNKEKLRHSSNISRTRTLVSGEKRQVGRPKKDLEEKEKVRTIRASDQFIALAKNCAKKDGYEGKWQTWLKAIATKHFHEQSIET